MMRVLSRTALKLAVLFLCVAIFSSPSSAHFKLNLNVRIIHVEQLSDGMQIYLRLPMPYLVAQLLGESEEGGLPEPAPYTYNRMEEGTLVHYVDAGQLEASTVGLGALVNEGLVLTIGESRVNTTVEQIRVYPKGKQPDFATLEDAKHAFTTEYSSQAFTQEVYVGDTTVDAVLRYTGKEPVDTYALSSNMDPGLPDQEQTANLLLDYRPGSTKVFRVRGLMHEPVVVSHSMLDAWKTFIGEGIKHILEGLDHVLFVICLVLGASQLRSLVWRATGFTLGHSVTLTLGFFGLVPSGAWFIPAVEAGIALSIIYAAVIAMRAHAGSSQNERSMFVVTCSIGLLHGLGFSFVLHKILQVTSPDIWQSLLAFNVGVEIGQLVIIMASWPLFYLLRKLGDPVWKLSRYALALACILIASMWSLQRITSVFETI